LRSGNGIAEKQGRHFRQLVRFIENDGIGRWQQFRDATILERHIGKNRW